MSDDEYNSDNNISDEEDIVPPKKPLFKLKQSIVKKTNFAVGDDEDDDDAEPDDAEPDEDGSFVEEESDEDDDETSIVGGADSDIEEGEIAEEEDDADPEEDVEEEDDSDIEINEDGEPILKDIPGKSAKTTKLKKVPLIMNDDDYDDDEDDDYDEQYLQKFDNEIVKNYVNDFHPECFNHNYDEIAKLSIVTKNSEGIIIDPLHRTIPYLTKYEKARVLGQRSKQIETGAKPLVKVPEFVIDAYIIAELELKEKKIPFIIRRPIPGGACEYWNLKDLEMIAF
jgi:DNA-directed RNA polymerase I, II, and III subunit RPABC2